LFWKRSNTAFNGIAVTIRPLLLPLPPRLVQNWPTPFDILVSWRDSTIFMPSTGLICR